MNESDDIPESSNPFTPVLYDDAWCAVFHFFSLTERFVVSRVAKQWHHVAGLGPVLNGTHIPKCVGTKRLRMMTASSILQRHNTIVRINSHVVDRDALAGLSHMKSLQLLQFHRNSFHEGLASIMTRVNVNRLTRLYFTNQSPQMNNVHYLAAFDAGCTFPALQEMGAILFSTDMLQHLCTRVPCLKVLDIIVTNRKDISKLQQLPMSLSIIQISNGNRLSSDAALERSEFHKLHTAKLQSIVTHGYSWANSMVAWIQSIATLERLVIARPYTICDFSNLRSTTLKRLCVLEPETIWPVACYPLTKRNPRLAIDIRF
jgi:hypothetical protein